MYLYIRMGGARVRKSEWPAGEWHRPRPSALQKR